MGSANRNEGVFKFQIPLETAGPIGPISQHKHLNYMGLYGMD
jgi:hypothetical protein